MGELSLAVLYIGIERFAMVGILVGFYFLSRELSLEYSHIFSEGIVFYRNLFSKLKILKPLNT